MITIQKNKITEALEYLRQEILYFSVQLEGMTVNTKERRAEYDELQDKISRLCAMTRELDKLEQLID